MCKGVLCVYMCVGAGEGRRNETLLTHFKDEEVRGMAINVTSFVLVGPRKKIEPSLVLAPLLLSTNPAPVRFLMTEGFEPYQRSPARY